MNNFNWSLKTDIYFGKAEIIKLKDILKEHKNILLVYGSGSIKRNGIYQEVQELLSGFNLYEVNNINPNPLVEDVERGVEVARENDCDCVLAIGGGSVIDCGKAIACGIYYQGSPWDFIKDSRLITKTLPIYCVLTLAATGSEMNDGAVITNPLTNEKVGLHHQLIIPKAAILDPSYLSSLPAYQTAAGAIDTISHALENYFKKGDDCLLIDSMIEGIVKTVIECAPIVVNNPNNYSAQANLMLASGMALNGLTGLGKSGKWSCHAMGHVLSAFYNVTHGVSLAIVTPRWMEYVLNDQTVEKFNKYGTNVWGLSGEPYQVAEKAISLTKEFFESLNIPMTLKELEITKKDFKAMAEIAVRNGSLDNSIVSLNVEDVVNIFEMCL